MYICIFEEKYTYKYINVSLSSPKITSKEPQWKNVKIQLAYQHSTL